LEKSRQRFGLTLEIPRETELARGLLIQKQDQPGRGIEFKNLGEGMNSGTTGLFLFLKIMNQTQTIHRGEYPAIRLELVLSA